MATAAGPPWDWQATEVACDDATNGGTLVQRSDTWYGNRFVVPCAGARVVSARFVHLGPGVFGTCAYRLHLLDADCREIGTSIQLDVPASPVVPGEAVVDLESYGWCVAGAFALVLEPLRCADGSAGRDCFPALVVDTTSDSDAAAHCAVVGAPAADGPSCLAPRSADGRFFDFRLRVELDCAASACATAVRAGTWTRAKRLFQ
jgi:hypothetical protein